MSAPKQITVYLMDRNGQVQVGISAPDCDPSDFVMAAAALCSRCAAPNIQEIARDLEVASGLANRRTGGLS
jgi:hypothetical protein